MQCGYQQLRKMGDCTGRDHRSAIIGVETLDFGGLDSHAAANLQQCGGAIEEIGTFAAGLDQYNRAIGEQRSDDPGQAGSTSDIDPSPPPLRYS